MACKEVNPMTAKPKTRQLMCDERDAEMWRVPKDADRILAKEKLANCRVMRT